MTLELNAKIREVLGGKVKTLRKKGIIPAVVYGLKAKSIPLEIDYSEFEKIFKEAGESTVIKLKTGKEFKNVLIYDVSRDPMSEKFIHVDFYEVRMDKPITAEVPLVFEGEAPAVKNLEGVLVKNITEIEVEALPANLPHEIKVDISSLNTFEDLIHVKDLKIPDGVKVLVNSDEIVALVSPPRSEEELKSLEEKVEEKIEEVAKVGEPAESPEGIQAGPPASQRGEPQSEGLGGEKEK